MGATKVYVSPSPGVIRLRYRSAMRTTSSSMIFFAATLIAHACAQEDVVPDNDAEYTSQETSLQLLQLKQEVAQLRAAHKQEKQRHEHKMQEMHEGHDDVAPASELLQGTPASIASNIEDDYEALVLESTHDQDKEGTSAKQAFSGHRWRPHLHHRHNPHIHIDPHEKSNKVKKVASKAANKAWAKAQETKHKKAAAATATKKAKALAAAQ